MKLTMLFRKAAKATQSGEARGLMLLKSVREMKARDFARATALQGRIVTGCYLSKGTPDAED